MPHYPGHEHGHQYEYLYGDDYDWGNMTSAEIGEAYYSTGGYMSNPIDDYWDNAGQYNINFWEELLSPYLNWTYMGGGSHGGAAGTEYSGAINFDNWWQDYGAYLPTDNILGHSSIMRTHRMADLEEENLQRDFGSQRSQLESQYGSTGFTGSGLYNQGSTDLWNQYLMQTQNLGLQTQQQFEGLYEQQGDEILSILEDLGHEGAFDIPEDWIACNCPAGESLNANNQCVDLDSGQVTGNACV